MREQLQSLLAVTQNLVCTIVIGIKHSRYIIEPTLLDVLGARNYASVTNVNVTQTSSATCRVF